MHFINISQLRENQITANIYSIEVFSDFVESISRQGILEPLVIRPLDASSKTIEIISGIRRYRAALELGITQIPVIIKEIDKVDEVLIIEHQKQRIKNPSELMKEIAIIQEKFGMKQGVRSDVDKNAKKGRALIDKMVHQTNQTKVDKLKRIHKLLNEIFGEDHNKKQREINRLDSIGSIHGTLKRLNKLKEEQENRKSVRKKYEVLREDIKIYNKPSEKLDEVESDSIQVIVTSPPYFDMRDYKTGEGELGHESSTDAFAVRLANHFDDCKRVLSPNGTLWVNLGD